MYNSQMGKLRKEKKCLNCGCLFKAWSSSMGLYCSNKCQKEFERKNKIAEWLKTGECFIGSKKNHYIKQHLLEEQDHRCVICSNINNWQNQELIFILDHIDGNSSNNKRENLRLVCSNCDSQLPTYKNRNKGNGRYIRRIRYKNKQSY